MTRNKYKDENQSEEDRVKSFKTQTLRTGTEAFCRAKKIVAVQNFICFETYFFGISQKGNLENGKFMSGQITAHDISQNFMPM